MATASYQRSGSTDSPDDLATARPPLTLSELILRRASEPATKDLPIFSYPSSGTHYVDYTPTEVNVLAERAAAFYSAFVPRRTSSDDAIQVVALLGPSTFDYFITLLGISRLGHTVLFLSPRLSEAAHLSLFRTTGACTLLVDDGYTAMADQISKQLPDLVIGKLASVHDFQNASLESAPETKLDPAREASNVAYIIHSSGSTSLPRPNFVTHAAAIGNSSSPVRLVGFVTLPLFHMWGLGCVFRGITNRKRVYMYNAHLPLTAQHLTRILEDHTDIQVMYTVPYALKLMAESAEGTRLLAGLESVMVGGSACPKPVGDKLVRAGVMLVTHLGSTETGQLMSSARPRKDILEWDWFRPSDGLTPYLRMEPQTAEGQNDITEAVILDGYPSKVVSSRSDGSYATKDLFERHPDWPRKKAWRYYARKDDTIVLSNGEKTNPLMLEGAAKNSPLVSEAIAVGTQKPYLGLFVVPSDTMVEAEDIITAIWPSIEQANRVVPAHAKLLRNMVRILSPEQAFKVRKTDKGSLMRAAFYKDFASEIEVMYDEGGPKGGLALDVDELRTWLWEHIKKIALRERSELLEDGTDLFALGVDSLEASRLRSLIARHVDIGGGTLSPSFVFDYPSIDAMATQLYRMRIGSSEPEKASIEERMRAMIDRYSSFGTHTPFEDATPGEHVLVTGATGSLGAHIVAQLTALKNVAKVYCLVRADSDDDAPKRLRHSLQERRIAADESKIDVHASVFGNTGLGLRPETYKTIASNLTSVIHCAWSVNFKLAIESFEHDCIRGTKHLLELCLKTGRSKPASFIFCSSISSVGNTASAVIPEHLPASLNVAQDMGYAQSKLVAEHLCMNAATLTGIVAKIMRIGQIVGDTQHGIWNVQEAVPMILQSATTVGALPTLDEQCSWLPVDTVAAAVRDVALATTAGTAVYHIVNPRTFDWTNDLLPMLSQAGLQFEAVGQKEWLRRLRRRDDVAANPPYKLVDFFTAKSGTDEALVSKSYLSGNAQAASPAVAQAPAVGQDLTTVLVRYLQARWGGEDS